QGREGADGGHEERRQGRPAVEEFGAHEVLGGLISTFAPGTSRSWPSVTTRSPARRPCSMMVSAPRRVPGATGRDSTVASGFTTKTNGPCWPGGIARDGPATPERPPGAVLLDVGQVLLGNRERDVDRVDLVDHDERAVVVGLDDVPVLDQEVPGAPVDRRADLRVPELEPGVVHVGLRRPLRGL